MTDPTDDPGPLTDVQRDIFVDLEMPSDIILLSVTEKATGLQRALIAHIDRSNLDAVEVMPLAMILDGEHDIDRFTPPGPADIIRGERS